MLSRLNIKYKTNCNTNRCKAIFCMYFSSNVNTHTHSLVNLYVYVVYQNVPHSHALCVKSTCKTAYLRQIVPKYRVFVRCFDCLCYITWSGHMLYEVLSCEKQMFYFFLFLCWYFLHSNFRLKTRVYTPSSIQLRGLVWIFIMTRCLKFCTIEVFFRYT